MRLLLRRLRTVPAGQRIQLGSAERANRGAHHRRRTPTVTVLLERLAEVIKILAGQVRHPRHTGVTGRAVTGRTQAKPVRPYGWRVLAPGNTGAGGDQTQDRGQ